MIGVGVRIDDSHYWELADFFVYEVQRCLGGFLGCQRIEHDPTRIPLDEADVGEVKAAHLVNPARYDLVEAISHVQDRLAL